jgi:hypothetical protein
MILIINVREMDGPYSQDIAINTADTTTYLVSPWMDPITPYFQIPDGYHTIGFRYFQLDNSITVYIGKGKLVPNDNQD